MFLSEHDGFLHLTDTIVAEWPEDVRPADPESVKFFIGTDLLTSMILGEYWEADLGDDRHALMTADGLLGVHRGDIANPTAVEMVVNPYTMGEAAVLDVAEQSLAHIEEHHPENAEVAKQTLEQLKVALAEQKVRQQAAEQAATS